MENIRINVPKYLFEEMTGDYEYYYDPVDGYYITKRK